MALFFQFIPQRLEVVNLTVEDHADGPILVGHGLTPGRGQIDDAEAAVAEAATDTALMTQIDAGIIRPPMRQETRHPSKEIFIDQGTREIKFSANAAH